MASMETITGEWYLRKRGQILGPYNAKQLIQLRERGQISRFHELSQDKSDWVSAELAGLFTPVAVPQQPAPSNNDSSTPSTTINQSSSETPSYAQLRSLSLSITMITIAYALEIGAWVLVGFLWLLGFLSDNYQLFQVAGIIVVGSTAIVGIVLIIGFGIGCSTGQHQLSAALPITCMVLQIIDVLAVLFAVILAVAAVIPLARWQDALSFNTGIIFINGLRFALALLTTISLIEWLRQISKWLRIQQAIHGISENQFNAFYFAYGSQIVLALLGTILLFSSMRVRNDGLRDFTMEKLSVLIGIVGIMYAMFQCVTAIWRVALLSMASRALRSRN